MPTPVADYHTNHVHLMVFIFFALPMHERRQLIDYLMQTVVQIMDGVDRVKCIEFATLIVQLTDYLLCQFVNASNVLEKLVRIRDVFIFLYTFVDSKQNTTISKHKRWLVVVVGYINIAHVLHSIIA